MKFQFTFLSFLLTACLLSAQELDLNKRIGSILTSSSANCIAGDCFDGVGVLEYDSDAIYFGEFKNGLADGFGVTFYNNKLIISEYKEDNVYGITLQSEAGKNIISSQRELSKGLNLNGNVLLSSSAKSAIFLFENNKIKSNSSKILSNGNNFFSAGIKNRITKDILVFKNVGSGKGFSFSKTILNKIKSRDDLNYSSSVQPIIYRINEFSMDNVNNTTLYTNNSTDLPWIRYSHTSISSNFIRVFYLTSTVAVLNIANKANNKNLYVTTNNGNIVDISFDKVKKNTNDFYGFSMHKDYQFFEYEFNKYSKNYTNISSVNTNINLPPYLEVENIKFNDINDNNLIEVNENSTISFNIVNKGQGNAYGINVNLNDINNVSGLLYDKNKYIGNLKVNDNIIVEIPISSSMSLKSGKSIFEVEVLERNGFGLEKFIINLETQEFISPNLDIVDFQFISENDKIKRGEINTLQFVIQNIGQGVAEDINISLKIPKNVFPADKKDYYIDQIKPGEGKQFNFKFFTNLKYEGNNLDIKSIITERYDKYGMSKTMSVELGKDVSSVVAYNPQVKIERKNTYIQKISLTSEVDKNIPLNSKVKDRYALIIGNEDYSSYQNTLSNEQDVEYAKNDANVFKDYALNTLGVKEENLFLLINATSGQMNQEIDLVAKIVRKLGDKAELIVYYAGHGFPDEQTKLPYLIPVDVTASNLSSAIKLDDLYSKLSSTNANKITVFLDACFTGGGRNKSLISSRGVKVVAKKGSLTGNLVVFSASSGKQSSLP